MVIVFTLITWYVFEGNQYVKYGAMQGYSWLQLIWETVSLQYIYGWADYLRFYAIFIALSPIALWLLRKGRWYIVLLLSFLVWWLFPINIHWNWEDIAIVQPVAWQIIFFSGLVIGFHWPDITGWCTNHKKALLRYVKWPVIVTAIVTLTWNAFAVFAPDFFHTNWAHDLSYRAWELRTNEFHKEQLPFARITLFFLWFWAAFLLVKQFEKPIVKYTGWLLIPFGTNSLYVYTLNAAMIYFIHIWMQPMNLWLNFLVVAGSIALTYLAIKTKFLMNIIPR